MEKDMYARTRDVGDAYSMGVVRYKKRKDRKTVSVGPIYLAAVASTAGSLLQLALPD